MGGEPWYVLENCQHPCYQLHLDKMPDHVDEWPVEILPYGDPCYILAPDFSAGILAKLRHSITVFGRPLVMPIQQNLPDVFTRVVQPPDNYW